MLYNEDNNKVTPEEYIKQQPLERQKGLNDLRQTILNSLPTHFHLCHWQIRKDISRFIIWECMQINLYWNGLRPHVKHYILGSLIWERAVSDSKESIKYH
jgi:hypothetical protein